MNPRWKIEKFQQVRRITVALWDNDSPPTDQALDIIEAVLSGVSLSCRNCESYDKCEISVGVDLGCWKPKGGDEG